MDSVFHRDHQAPERRRWLAEAQRNHDRLNAYQRKRVLVWLFPLGRPH